MIPALRTFSLGALGAGALLVGVVACSSPCGGDPGVLTSFNEFVFPECNKQRLQFPAEETGGIIGQIVDANSGAKAAPVQGAAISFGARRTTSGTDDKRIRVADAVGAIATMSAGEFVLTGIPVNTQVTLAVSYDGVTKTFPITIDATNDFQVAAGTGSANPAGVRTPYGLKNIGTLDMPFLLPKSKHRVRLAFAVPTGLTAEATGSKTTFTPDGLVAFGLRNGPGADSEVVTCVQVTYTDERGIQFAATRSVTPTVVARGGLGESGPISTVQADISDASLASRMTGNVSAQINFLKRHPLGDCKVYLDAEGDDDPVAHLERKIPVTIKRL